MRSVNCRLASPWVTALGAGDEVSFAPVRNHIDTCLHCQASIARQRRLRRSLEDLASVSVNAPRSTLSRASGQRSSLARPVVLGALGAALAVGIGVVGFRRTVVG